jgi:UDP-glucose 4-epimerase
LENTSSGAGINVLLVGGCGYIGSYMHGKLKQNGFGVTVVDRGARGNPGAIPDVIDAAYDSLDADFLAAFDAVLWFGGHSSVGQSVQDPKGALSNNCLDLFNFAKKLRADTKLIYASSGSLYSSKGVNTVAASEASLAAIPSQNPYDISKFAFDYIAQNFLDNFYALRMGTLSGYSPNIREELVFNAMNLSAVRTGQVRLMNSESNRTILFLADLWVLLRKLLVTKQQPGIFNVGSNSFRMGELAHVVAMTWDAQVLYQGESETYSFLLDTTKMKAICGAELPVSDLQTRCREFIADYRAGKGSV